MSEGPTMRDRRWLSPETRPNHRTDDDHHHIDGALRATRWGTPSDTRNGTRVAQNQRIFLNTIGYFPYTGGSFGGAAYGTSTNRSVAGDECGRSLDTVPTSRSVPSRSAGYVSA